MKRNTHRAFSVLLVAVLALTAAADCAPAAAETGSVASKQSSAEVEIQANWNNVSGKAPAYYGVEYSWVDQDRELFLERYHLLRPNLLRVQITQEYFEPVNDNADPKVSRIDFNLALPVDPEKGKTLTYRDMFTTLAREFPQMHFQINIWLAARWNAANPEGYLDLGGAFPPRDYDEHGEFVRELARWLVDTCGIAPQRLSFAFINEPNLKPFFSGTRADLLKLAAETRLALNQVSPQIQMDGLDEVHGTSWTDQFYLQQPAGCCSRWTFHAYERGVDKLWSTMQTRINHLSDYGPVWVTEFADTANGSPDAEMDFSTRSSALGFAQILGRLWSSGVDGLVHFRLADSYIDVDPMHGWAGHGLFGDWRGTKSEGEVYGPYPTFWVFANYYNAMAGGQVVKTISPADLVVAASRHTTGPRPCLVLWAVNPTSTTYRTNIQVSDFPGERARVEILDNLSGNTPVATGLASGSPLKFDLTLPGNSSYTLKIISQTSGQVLTAPTTLLTSSPSQNYFLYISLTFALHDLLGSC